MSRRLAIGADHARRFLVRRQLLDPPRSLPPRAESVLHVVSRLGSLQFDPLEPAGARNHDLVLLARVRGYRREHCDRWLYGQARDRRLFEAYNKSLNILPIDELPYYRIAWDRAHERYAGTILTERAGAVRTILDRLDAEGPLATTAFKDMGEAVAWHWAPTAEGRAALEALFESGRVGIARRDGSKRTYDRIERLFPAELLSRRVPPEESLRHRLLSRYRAVGLMGEGGAPELVAGTGTAAERSKRLAQLVGDGTLIQVDVEGLRGPRHVLADELDLLEATARPPRRRAAGVTLLAPLDPLMWDRRLVRALFGFDYIWEVYTPEAKRRHGYYVLPLLFGERIVGRIEPRLDRGASRRRRIRDRAQAALEIIGFGLEPGFELDEPGFVPALAETLEALRRFAGVERLTFGRARAVRALAQAIARQAGARAAPT